MNKLARDVDAVAQDVDGDLWVKNDKGWHLVSLETRARSRGEDGQGLSKERRETDFGPFTTLWKRPKPAGRVIRDHDGDTWTRDADGRWRMDNLTSTPPLRKSQLRRLYGPLTKVKP